MMKNQYGKWTLILSLALLAAKTYAQDLAPQPAEEWGANAWGAKVQATFISQSKARFQAPYAGQNSLDSAAASSYSLTATAYLGYRLFSHGRSKTELYFNPELVQGVAFSNLTGLAGLSNGELQKTAGEKLILYRARLFTRTSWSLDDHPDAQEPVTSEQNQLAGVRSRQRVALTLGNFAASDVFDQNSYAHDARTQFINWSFLTHGAYDFAADAKGYSWGATLEYVQPNWAIRAGRFLQPKESNGLALNSRIIESYYRMQWGKQQLSLGGQWIANPAYNADRGPVRLLHLRWHVDF